SICQQTIHPIPFPDPLLHLKRPRQPSTTLFPYTTLFRSYSPRRTPEGAAAAPGMMEKKDEKKREDIRVIDRRMFTSDGQRRDPDLPFEELLPAPHGVGAAPGTEAPRAAAAPGSRQDQVASAHFVSLVRNLAATAAANLGEMPNPFTGQVEVDLDGARQVIDLLQALQMKTRGNLTADEARLLESLFYVWNIAVVYHKIDTPSLTS